MCDSTASVFCADVTVGGMDNEPPDQDQLPPQGFYPEPLPISEADQRRYDEIGERIVARLQEGRQRGRWRPREPS